jgi:endonuclease/exonuclease/phosphatase family metal-dependent hydrolase
VVHAARFLEKPNAFGKLAKSIFENRESACRFVVMLLKNSDPVNHRVASFGVLLALALAVIPRNVSAQPVRVMQWNVEKSLGNISSNSSPAALAVARIVKYNQPDVLLLNEVDDNGSNATRTALIDWVTNNVPYLGTQSFYVAVSSLSDGFNRNCAISRYPISNATTYNDGLRGLHSFKVQLTLTNLQVFHTHLKCCSDDCQRKQDEAQFSSDVMKAFAATNSSPYIFAGDLNEEEEKVPPVCTLSATYHPITTLKTNGALAEFKPTTLNGEYRTWSTASTTPSIRFDYLLPATNRLTPTSGFVFSTMNWAANGLYTNASPLNLTNDSKTASDHYCVFADFVFATNTPPNMTVTPTNNFSSAGLVGGPFSPANQVYTISNSGSVSLSWSVARTANWLTLSATNGTLAMGIATNVTVSINANANSLTANTYADTVSFTNVSGGTGSTTRAVSLIVTNPVPQLTVSPGTMLTSSGPAGGPFNPSSQIYTLSNSGSGTLNWTASNASNWIALSAFSGTLAATSNTTVTVSINNNANALAAGAYSDIVSFANANNGLGNTTRSVNLTITNASSPASFGFFDDFSAFTFGNLVGQSNWTQVSTVSSLPLQVSSGRVVVPFGQSIDNQDAYKNFPATNGTVFYGMTLIVTNAPTNSSPSYFAALYTSNNAAGFANYRLVAKDNGGGTCVLGIRITGQSGNPFTFGTSGLAYGSEHRVVVECDSGGTIAKIFVDPTSPALNAQTFYASNNIATGTPPPQVGSFVISQFGSVTVPNDGVTIGKVIVSDDFAAVYNALGNPLSPFELWQIQYFGSTNNPSASVNADPDGDQQNNYAEFTAGTIPTNSASVFRIATVTREGNNLRIAWTMGSGKTNALQVSSGNVTGVYSDLISVVTVGSMTNYLDVEAATNPVIRYYRARIVP